MNRKKIHHSRNLSNMALRLSILPFLAVVIHFLCLVEGHGKWDFAVANNRDVFVIKKTETGIPMTEVHILKASSNYKKFALQTKTALGKSDSNWTFALSSNRDVLGFKRVTGSLRTEIYILSEFSDYKYFPLWMSPRSALHETDSTWAFAIAPNRDAFCIKKSRTGTKSTEIHILRAGTYKSFILQTGTALHETDETWEFGVAQNRDVIGIKKSKTDTRSTEIHVLSASSGYKRFSLQTGTALEETDSTWNFAIAPNRDVVGIKRANTGTGTTEIHILSAAKGYKSFSLQTGTALHLTPP